MDKERQKAISVVKKMQPAVMEQLKSEKADWTYYGKHITFSVNGQERTIYHFSSGKEAAPVYFDIHGGGFAWGTIEDGNFYCHELAKTLKMNVYSLDYPLSPDNVYPSQLDYLIETINYMVTHPEKFGIDPQKIFVGGRSAGGNLAAALCLRTINQKNWSFRAQVLDHPWLDLKELIPDEERFIPEGINMMDNLRCLGRAYASAKQRETADCSPIAADKDMITLLPPAVIQTCEMDSLRNDGDMYAKILKEAGVQVIHRVAPKVGHGFTEHNTPSAEDGRKWLIKSLISFL